ncbi:hypothetical protein A3Q56_04852 [Intoshia linei]|uniref:tRNA (adenine(58)-N(1))-methyltransferase catalytic subunit TRMT61A n=1 Tax=Intoshia linei TaxID=1819745 RepID=A0A177B1B0_9BILA|nr:hypothetical protein A3Q56_04852 [Intoshia linei]
MMEKKIKDGDIVVIFFDYKNIYRKNLDPIRIDTKYGAILKSDLIGKMYGSIGKTNTNIKYYILEITPEIYTRIGPNMTRYLYTNDISQIVYNLSLKPGSSVIETGTGSAKLSFSILKSILPTGKLFSFDIDDMRILQAKKDMNLLINDCIDENFICETKDFTKDEFENYSCVDALFLDLPSPWLAMKNVVKLLNIDGRFASFSPCIEQIQKTVLTMKRNFDQVEVYEFVKNHYGFRKFDYSEIINKDEYTNGNLIKTEKQNTIINFGAPIGHTGYLLFASLTNKLNL